MTSRSVTFGGLASAGLVAFYVVVVLGLSGSTDHLADQARADWYYLVPIVVGFGVQVALLVELRHRHAARGAAAVAGGMGGGASTAGMIACCAHHLGDFAPLIGASGAAAFLTDYRVPLMVAGIAVNAVGVGMAGRKLRAALVCERAGA